MQNPAGRSDGVVANKDFEMSVSVQKNPGPIRINNHMVTEEDIAREMQYHPAENLREARHQAALALSIRALLVSEAERLGITGKVADNMPAGEDDRIRTLLERELNIPEPDETACRNYFSKNRSRFHGPSRYQVSHIFRPAPADDADARAAARNRCRRLIRVLRAEPQRFGRLARRHSRCPSAEMDGLLGEVMPGQTCSEFERALEHLPAGEVSAYPIETRYGFHVIWLHQKKSGEHLLFETVRPVIEEYLRESVWRRAVSQYLRILAGRAEIHGIELDVSKSPLVQ